MTLKTRIHAHVLKHKHVTFAELERIFPEVVENPPAGEPVQIMQLGFPNLVAWMGWTAEAFAAVGELRNERQIDFEPCAPLFYMVDGKVLQMKLAKKPKAYKTLRWVPIALTPPS